MDIDSLIRSFIISVHECPRIEYINVAQLISGTSTFSTSDTDGKYCVIVGTNSYSIKIKNRMGGSRSVRCMFLGTHT